MALLEFRSPAAGGFFMMPETFATVCKVLDRPYAEQGCWLAENLDGVIAALETEVKNEAARLAEPKRLAREREAREGRGYRSFAEEEQAAEEKKREDERVSFGMRVFPLLEMLRAARKKKVKVMWGVP